MSTPGRHRPQGDMRSAQHDATPVCAAALSLQRVSCTFIDKHDPGQRYMAVRDLTLTVGAGEFVSVVGPTGCGKSTLLKVAAGLLAPSTGRVEVFGSALNGINARAGYRFQSESLMPWRTALGNVMAGLEFRGVAGAKAQAEDWLRRVGLGASATATRTSCRAARASAPRWHRRGRSTPTSSSWTKPSP